MDATFKENYDMFLAARRGDAIYLRKCIDERLKKGNYTNVDYELLLYFAASRNSSECVKVLLSTKPISFRSCGRFILNGLDHFSCDIIQLILRNDPDFHLIRDSAFRAENERGLKQIETITDTLKDMRCPFRYAFNLVQHGSDQRFYEIQTDIEKTLVINIFKNLIDLKKFRESGADDLMVDVKHILLPCPAEVQWDVFKYLVAKWRSAKQNKYNELVKQSNSNRNGGNRAYLQRIFDGISRYSTDFASFFGLPYVIAVLCAAMPFSMDITADVSIENIITEIGQRRQFLEELEMKEEIKKFDAHWGKELPSLDGGDPILLKFCIGGKFRAKSSLASLCRAEIRKSVLISMGTEKSHLQLVKNIRSLALPETLVQFLLYNYINYDL